LDSYDADVDTEVAEMKMAFVARGYSYAEALSKAVGYVLGTPTQKAEARKTDVGKNVDTANRQPGRMKAGADNGANGMSKGINIMELSEKEFDNLTPEQLADLRGDNI